MKQLIKIGLLLILLGIGIFGDIFAKANALTFPTYFKFKFSDWEYFNPSITPPVNNPDGIEDNWGVARVTDIWDVTQQQPYPKVWDYGTDGEDIRVFFRGLDLAYWDGTTYKMSAVQGGAYLDMYLWDSDDPGYVDLDLNTANRSGSSYTTITNGGVHLATFEFTYGVTNDTSIITAGSTTDGSNPPNGTGTAFLKVVPNSGIFANDFNQNAIQQVLNTVGVQYDPSWLDPEADLYIKFDISPLTTPIGGFQVYSEDPGFGAVPEPGTLILLGSAFLFVGGYSRKKGHRK